MTAPIHNIAYDSTSKHILVGSSAGRPGDTGQLANILVWIKSNAVESTTVDDVPVEVKFHSTSGSCFIAWLQEAIRTYAHSVNYNHEVFLDKLWSFTYTGLSSGISLSKNHLVIKTLFNGLLWVDIETHDLIHTSPSPRPWQAPPLAGTVAAFKPDGPLLIVGTSDELGAILYRSFYFYRVGSFCPWFPVGVVAGIMFIGGVVAVVGLPNTKQVQTCIGFSLGVVTGAFLSRLIWSRFARTQGETAELVKVKGDHDSVVPESDNPWDNSGDRQHDTYVNEAMQSLDPQVMGQPGHLHGTLHTRDSDHDQDRDREHVESEEEEKSEVPGWQELDVPAWPNHELSQ
ncbi:hypothetical protein GGX14DRAFT_389339 [Mycena pura]|uniref:Transmembrane protein n=1 Tax=Mycena pura TaxID=153505 RepID=A0AAD6YJQ6_9AGAR|nr:hypothetical protein GGX14DRAFT_389339 [Mycena pura]